MNKEIKLNILSSIQGQTSFLFDRLKFLETEFYKKEQAEEAKQAERFIEQKEKKQNKESDNEVKKVEKKVGILGTLLNIMGKSLIQKAIFVAPFLINFFKENEGTIKNFPTTIKTIFNNVVDTLKNLIDDYIIDPMTNFFTVKLPSAWQVLTEIMQNLLDDIIDVPVLILNSVKIMINDVQLGVVTNITDFLKNIERFVPKSIIDKLEQTQSELYNEQTSLIKREELLRASRAERDQYDAGERYRDLSGEKAKEKPKDSLKVSTSITQEIPIEARALLDTIALKESRGRYDIIVGEGNYGAPAYFTDFSKHPNIVGMRTPRGSSTAAGRYQFLYSTWTDLQRRYPSAGLNDFSPENQDKGAWILAQENYAKRTNGRNLADDLKSSDATTIANIGRSLSKTWTSLAGGVEQAQGMSDEYFVARYEEALQRQMESQGSFVPVPASTEVSANEFVEPEEEDSTIVMEQPQQVPVAVVPQSKTSSPPKSPQASSQERQAEIAAHFGISYSGFGSS